jgi:hypothetical protein
MVEFVIVFTAQPPYFGERAPDTDWTEDWVGSRNGMDAWWREKNYRPFLESNSSHPSRTLVTVPAIYRAGISFN